MEGLVIGDMYREENELDTEEINEKGIEKTSENITEKRKVGKLPLIIIFVIGLLIGIIISPYVFYMFNEETPIYQQYTKIRGEDSVIWKNEELNTQIMKENQGGQNYYTAIWTNVSENSNFPGYYYTQLDLLDAIIYDYSGELNITQLKWFNYMLKNIVK